MLGIDKNVPPRVEGEFAKKVRDDLARAREGGVPDVEKKSGSDQAPFHADWLLRWRRRS